MVDEKDKKPEGKEPATENNEDGVQQKTISELDRADQIAERQKRENDRREELLTREENLAARQAVGGVAEAGQTPVKVEESNSDYANKVMANDLK